MVNNKNKTKAKKKNNSNGSGRVSLARTTQLKTLGQVKVVDTSSALDPGPSVLEGDELIGDIHLLSHSAASGGYHCDQTFRINAHSKLTFPRLAHIAQAWDRYMFKYLMFYTTTGVSTDSPGIYGLCIDYDSVDPAPLSHVQASNTVPCVESAFYRGVKITPNKRLNQWFYGVEADQIRSIERIRGAVMCDFGNLHVFSQSGNADHTVQLRVRYVCWVEGPQLPSTASVGVIRGTGSAASGTSMLEYAYMTEWITKGLSLFLNVLRDHVDKFLTLRSSDAYSFTITADGTGITGLSTGGTAVDSNQASINAGATHATWTGKIDAGQEGATWWPTIGYTTLNDWVIQILQVTRALDDVGLYT